MLGFSYKIENTNYPFKVNINTDLKGCAIDFQGNIIYGEPSQGNYNSLTLEDGYYKVNALERPLIDEQFFTGVKIKCQ